MESENRFSATAITSRENSPPFSDAFSYDLSKPHATEALHKVVDEWGDKTFYWVLKNGDKLPREAISSSSPVSLTTQVECREIHLSSYNKEVAIARFFPDGRTYLQVIPAENNRSLIDELITNKRALIAGVSEKAQTDLDIEIIKNGGTPGQVWKPRDVRAVHQEAIRLANENAHTPTSSPEKTSELQFTLPQTHQDQDIAAG